MYLCDNPEKMLERPFFSLLYALEDRGYYCTYKEIERGSDSFIAHVTGGGILAWFGEEAWGVSDDHMPLPRLCGGFCADAAETFCKISSSPLQVSMPETQEQIDELLEKLEFLVTKHGRFEYEKLRELE